MPLNLNPRDWYWFIGGDTTRAYSSKLGDYVLVNDPAYQAWLLINSMPSASLTDSEATIGAFLAGFVLQQMPGLTVTSTVLVIQQALRQAQLDLILINNADMVTMIKAGNSTTITGTGVANFLAQGTNNYRTLRASIAAAATPAAVRAVAINSGWPNNP